ncbi:hypothetical protein ACIBKX_33785 [Streptomyces sp. NPDC050658]|uniref:class I SAM-dependent methyltransferase n=1 Tax=unclassified Streptomyces TaxID=2593676 RepID=UPI0034163F3E
MFAEEDARSPAHMADAFTDVATLGRLCRGALSLARPGPTRELFCTTVAHFTKACREAVEQYLSNAAGLDNLTELFIQSLFSTGLPAQSHACRDELTVHRARLSAYVSSVVTRTLPRRPELNLLSYGGGDCFHEVEIARQAVASGLTQHVNLYRFDPLGAEDGIAVNLSEADLHASASLPRMDLVTAFNCLHHVRPADRWGQVAAVLRCLSRPGSLAIWEESLCAPASRHHNLVGRAHSLFLMQIDVLWNALMSPQWVQSSGLADDMAFFIRYLTAEDLSDILGHLPQPTSYKVHPVTDADGFGSTLLMHRLLPHRPAVPNSA